MNQHNVPTDESLLKTAINAAQEGAKIILQGAKDRASLHIEHKQLNDLVSEIDRNAEMAIISVIKHAYPAHHIVAEETASQLSLLDEQAPCWIIDPLDGTTNFLHGLDQYAVSIALNIDGQTRLGVVFNPQRNELFTAMAGKGAWLNGQPIHVAARSGLIEGLISTGLPWPAAPDAPVYFQLLDRIWQRCRNMRRLGAASLDLAFIAAGRLDGFFEFSLKPWDVAAGALLIKEAGGVVSDIGGGQRYLHTGYILAGSPQVHADMLAQSSPLASASGLGSPANPAPD